MAAGDLEVVVPRMAPMSKSDALAFARTGRMRFERYDTSDLKLRRYGETRSARRWVVVTESSLCLRSLDGDPAPLG